MSTEVTVALVALAGVVISVAVSLYGSMRQTNAELKKLRAEIQQTYADKLLGKRLEMYPDMYFLLSDFMKKIESHSVSKEDVDSLYHQGNEWNSRYSIFFSASTNLISYNFRKMLAELIELDAEELKRKFESSDALRELKSEVGKFELALKNDLGIYIVEYEDLRKSFTSYKELAESVQTLSPRSHRS